MISVGIIGASGFTGAELLRICAIHPHFEVKYATGDSQAGTLARSLYPSLAATYPNLVFEEFDFAKALACDVLFLGLPHEASLELVPQLVNKVKLVVDLSAAFRLTDTSKYPQWYGFTHTHPELVASAVYGLPELHREQLKTARLIATPGCYVTAASLALQPLVKAGVIDPIGVIVDAASGVSGAGRAAKHSNSFTTVDEDFTAYGLLDHRHTPEIEQVTGAQILFTPPYGADESWNPGNVLRATSSRNNANDRVAVGNSRTCLCKGATRCCGPELSFDQGNTWHERHAHHSAF